MSGIFLALLLIAFVAVTPASVVAQDGKAPTREVAPTREAPPSPRDTPVPTPVPKSGNDDDGGGGETAPAPAPAQPTPSPTPLATPQALPETGSSANSGSILPALTLLGLGAIFLSLGITSFHRQKFRFATQVADTSAHKAVKKNE
ncbi:MAG TPA: hypothetical protein G4N96_00100 [Chloroflexi bacterium]|nr:hypothetical protein [Chloroflexota bacterium]